MKFLLVSPFTSISGSAIRFWNIAQQLHERGHKVIYVERRPRGAPRPMLDGVTYLTTRVRRNLYLDILVSLVYNLTVLLRNLDCSVYYALKPAPNNCIPALLAKLLGKRIFLDIDDLDYGYLPNGLRQRVSRFFFEYFPHHFALVTCHTEKLKAHIIKYLNVKENKVFFLAQGLSGVFEQYRLEEKPGDVKKSIVYLATLGITSDLDDLLPMFVAVCEQHPNLRIKIIGDGVRREYFEDKMTQLGIARNVLFLGRIEHGLIPAVLADTWIGLNYMRPSYVNQCRAVLKIREYLAVGLQVVCNDCGDASLFREHAFVEPDIAHMESRINEILTQGPQVNVEGRRFLEEHFTRGRIVDGFLGRIEVR